MAKPTSLVTCEETKEKFKTVLQANGINDDISEVIVQEASLKTAGYTTQTHYVTVNFANSDLKPLNLFVKTETGDDEHKKFLEDTKLFEKEAVFFTKYVPALEEFCQSRGHESLLHMYPKCYFGSKNMIVFENLVVDRGFELLDRESRQDFDAACLSLITLAKHHVISLAIIKRIGGIQEFSTRFPELVYDTFTSPTMRETMESSMEDAVNISIQIIQNSNVPAKEEAISMLKAKSGKAWETITKYSQVHPNDDDEDELVVLNHGDYHNDNGLFLRGKVTKKLIDHIAVDFQATRLNSPTLDICNFLYTSVKHEVRRNNLEELLKVYLDAFNSTCAKLECQINLSYEKLFEMFCKKVGYGVWFLGLMFTSSAGYAAFKEIDTEKIEMHNWKQIYSDLVQKWITANPETCERDAENYVAMLTEYKNYSLLYKTN